MFFGGKLEIIRGKKWVLPTGLTVPLREIPGDLFPLRRIERPWWGGTLVIFWIGYADVLGFRISGTRFFKTGWGLQVRRLIMRKERLCHHVSWFKLLIEVSNLFLIPSLNWFTTTFWKFHNFWNEPGLDSLLALEVSFKERRQKSSQSCIQLIFEIDIMIGLMASFHGKYTFLEAEAETNGRMRPFTNRVAICYEY